jgi:hypothetical protein
MPKISNGETQLSPDVNPYYTADTSSIEGANSSSFEHSNCTTYEPANVRTNPNSNGCAIRITNSLAYSVSDAPAQ